MAISAPCSWRNSRLEACPRASGPPWCHGRTGVNWCRRASMVLRDCSCLSRHRYRGHHSCVNNRKNPPRGLVVPLSIQQRTVRRPTTRVRNARTQAASRLSSAAARSLRRPLERIVRRHPSVRLLGHPASAFGRLRIGSLPMTVLVYSLRRVAEGPACRR